MSAPGRPLEEVRARFEEDRARLVERHRQGTGGGENVHAYRRLVDATVRTLADRLLSGGQPLAVLAVGGYGRGELAFGSDLDLHLVHAGPEPPAGVRPFIQSLWDLGPRIGHQVVTVEEALDLAASDAQTLTAALEMRPLWGDTGLAVAYGARIRRQVLEPRRRTYLETKVAELERRHREAGDTVYLSEPDVKESPGGLRDLHTLLWLSNATGGPRTWGEYLARFASEGEVWRRLQEAWDRIWRVRNALHLLKGRPWDRLDHAGQLALSEELAYTGSRGRLPVEVFMREYYRAAWEVYAFTRLQLARGGWELRGGGPAALAVLAVAAAGEGVVRWNPEDLEEAPLAVVNGFRRLAENRARLAGETADYLHRHGRRLGTAARAHPGHGRFFLELLEAPHAAWSLHAMHQLGVLGGVLPEFERLTALVQFDPYHHYTADEHTLRMLDVLEAVLDPESLARPSGPVLPDFTLRQDDPAPPGATARPDVPARPNVHMHQAPSALQNPLAAAAEELPGDRWRPAPHDIGLLRLAILYHDIAKGTRTGGHAERGARMLQTAGRRLGLERADLADAVFLVRHHLVLSEAAQRRDIREEALLRRLQRLVRNPRRLRLLALLTVCDQAAMAPGVLTPWKVRLLVELVERLQEWMAGGPAPGPEHDRARVLRGLRADRLEAARLFLAAMPPHYARELEEERLFRDRELVSAFLAAEPTLVPAPDQAPESALDRTRDQAPDKAAQKVPDQAPEPVPELALDRTSERVIVEVEQRKESSLLTLVARDRPALLARICGLLAAHDVTILQARIFTRLDGVILDRFIVADAARGGPLEPGQIKAVRGLAPDALSGRLDVEKLLEAHRARWRLRDRPRMRHATRVAFDPVASDRYTVVEVRARDQVGLLHDVTLAMAELGVAIHQAYITTEGERAVDAFYVTDPLGAPLDEPTRRILADRLREAIQKTG